MPRRSSADLATPRRTAAPVRGRLRPSPDLPEPAASVFRALTESVDAEHFRGADRPLLEELAVALVVARNMRVAALAPAAALEARDLLRALRDQQRLIASLAIRCRLAPSSRITKRGAATGTDVRAVTVDFGRLNGK